MLSERPFFYLRHGETDWNAQRRALGQRDVPLNARGRVQARAAARRLSGSGIATICASPLCRARETARIVSEALKRPLLLIEDLKEACWGEREGEVKGAWFAAWERGVTPPGAEPVGAFLERALRGINAALQQQGPVLIVAHGAVYWAIERNAQLVRQEAVPNGIPLRHEPPRPGRPLWTVEAMT